MTDKLHLFLLKSRIFIFLSPWNKKVFKILRVFFFQHFFIFALSIFLLSTKYFQSFIQKFYIFLQSPA